jgi:hypothetical protein
LCYLETNYPNQSYGTPIQVVDPCPCSPGKVGCANQP